MAENLLAQLMAWLTYNAAQPLQFSSGLFLAAFVPVYLLFALLRRRIAVRNFYLLFVSLFFYYKASGIYFLLLLSTAWVDFTLAHFLYHARGWRRKGLLTLSLAGNLGVLGWFKYSHFFAEAANSLLGTQLDWEALFLPVGISFFTFQSLSYSIDVYRGQLEPLSLQKSSLREVTAGFLNYCFYISFFPQLVAGPIVRAASFLPQIGKPSLLTREQAGQAIFLFCCGLFKKVILSDTLGVLWVDRVFENPALYSGIGNLLAVYGYAFQIYLDFSGYSDMAIGLALAMGFQLTENFRRPYLSATLQDFWRRWHISLSTWLRDYLYISMGGSREGVWRTYRNLFLTMLLGGLWHGAGWMFLLWGALHGAGLALDRWLGSLGNFLSKPLSRTGLLMLATVGGLALWLQVQAYTEKVDTWQVREWQTTLAELALGVGFLTLLAGICGAWENGKGVALFVSGFFTFQFTAFCWIFFRSGSSSGSSGGDLSGRILGRLSDLTWNVNQFQEIALRAPYVLPALLAGLILHLSPPALKDRFASQFTRLPLLVQVVMVAVIVLSVLWLNGQRSVPFIYFQF